MKFSLLIAWRVTPANFSCEAFCELRPYGVSTKYAWPRSYADDTHGRILGSLGAGSPERGYGCRSI
jgi:hypothetical protein